MFTPGFIYFRLISIASYRFVDANDERKMMADVVNERGLYFGVSIYKYNNNDKIIFVYTTCFALLLVYDYLARDILHLFYFPDILLSSIEAFLKAT